MKKQTLWIAIVAVCLSVGLGVAFIALGNGAVAGAVENNKTAALESTMPLLAEDAAPQEDTDAPKYTHYEEKVRRVETLLQEGSITQEQADGILKHLEEHKTYCDGTMQRSCEICHHENFGLRLNEKDTSPNRETYPTNRPRNKDCPYHTENNGCPYFTEGKTPTPRGGRHGGHHGNASGHHENTCPRR